MSYESCLMSNPAFEFNDGDTVFRLDRHGFFYFISGNPGHCRAGQKLVVRVMVQSRVHPSHGPDATPHPAEGGNSGCSGGWDSIWSPPLSAANRLSVASPTMIALGGVSIILYLFM